MTFFTIRIAVFTLLFIGSIVSQRENESNEGYDDCRGDPCFTGETHKMCAMSMGRQVCRCMEGFYNYFGHCLRDTQIIHCPEGWVLSPDNGCTIADDVTPGRLEEEKEKQLAFSDDGAQCDSGFTFVNGWCTDIDECEEMHHPCGEVDQCINNHGSYFCVTDGSESEEQPDVAMVGHGDRHSRNDDPSSQHTDEPKDVSFSDGHCGPGFTLVHGRCAAMTSAEICQGRHAAILDPRDVTCRTFIHCSGQSPPTDHVCPPRTVFDAAISVCSCERVTACPNRRSGRITEGDISVRGSQDTLSGSGYPDSHPESGIHNLHPESGNHNSGHINGNPDPHTFSRNYESGHIRGKPHVYTVNRKPDQHTLNGDPDSHSESGNHATHSASSRPPPPASDAVSLCIHHDLHYLSSRTYRLPDPSDPTCRRFAVCPLPHVRQSAYLTCAEGTVFYNNSCMHSRDAPCPRTQ